MNKFNELFDEKIQQLIERKVFRALTYREDRLSKSLVAHLRRVVSKNEDIRIDYEMVDGQHYISVMVSDDLRKQGFKPLKKELLRGFKSRSAKVANEIEMLAYRFHGMED